MASRKPVTGMCEEHQCYMDICVPCAEVMGAVRALRALARWCGRGSRGAVPADSIAAGFKIAAAEALSRARKLEGKR